MPGSAHARAGRRGPRQDARRPGAGLTEAGYAVDAVGDGAAALSYAASRTYDAVVLDVMLPGMDGFEVCRTLRDRGSGRR
ncbi:response regulator [Blastococcus brunescens]|uniref:Response regulator n=1 Tax=Blastococcus brunescens TaxID=1564165 RepID=A0ABZ1B529_9ACTN|nr:response regulator [Blastococcus sp. BMG 8361]WRL65907.1 response regulator [Blastococcus sp. BMG 8361]